MKNKEKEKATADSWGILPVTGDSVTKAMDFLLTDHQMQQIAMGHIPDAMEDHWFMYCDDQYIRYYRSWTGRCAFIAKYKKIDSGYKICELTIPDDDLRKKGAANINFDALSMMFLSLLMDECGGDSEYYWKKYRELKEMQQGISELKNN